MGGCEIIQLIVEKMDTSDWVNVIGLLTNVVLTIWIVRVIQNNLTNKRHIKDYFIDEVRLFSNDYRLFLDSLSKGECDPRHILKWFKSMSIRVDDFMSVMKDQYKINDKMLSPYQGELRELITECKEFEDLYASGRPIDFTQHSLSEFHKFQKMNSKLFTELIIKINNS